MPRSGSSSIVAVDLFAGAGGTSTGLVRACESLGLSIDLTAINHWPVAIATHEKNHPWAKHLCVPIESVDPRAVVPRGRVDLLVASPECTHFSQARGGRPTSDQLRASGWNIMRWVEILDVRAILIENVPEYRNWGPVDPVTGQPDKKRKGQTFQAFLAALRSFGYTVDYRILNAADYGEATARKRLFVLARKDGQPIAWPNPTHSEGGVVPGTLPWRAAEQVVDLSLPGENIFARSTPLRPKTLLKIARGLREISGLDVEAELLTQQAVELELDGTETLRCPEPIILTTDRPETNRSLPRSLKDPLPTVTGNPRVAVFEPFIIERFGERPAQRPRVRPLQKPLPTVTSRGAGDLIQPFIIGYNGRGSVHSLSEPLPTVTTHDRFALVVPWKDGQYLGVLHRTLVPHELSRAMGFGDGYSFTGTRTQVVKQIGNAVGVNVARALCESILIQTGAA